MDDTSNESHLRERVAELEQQVDALQQRLQLFQWAIDALPQTIFWKDRDLIYRGCSQRFATFAGFDSPAGVIGKSDYALAWKPEESDAFRADDREVLESGLAKEHIVETQRHADGTETWVETSKIPLRDAAGNVIGVVGTYEDITERVREEAARAQQQAEVIAAQAAVLAELSTPLIPLADGVIALPLVGTIDSRRAQQVMETLLEGIGAYQADTAIIDITGVRVVDTQVADALLRTARAAQLLGARVVLTGINAEVAQALVHLGADLSQIKTLSNLQSAIATVFDQSDRHT